jgi:tetratricopeptide (TPR) repeat protein
MDTLFEQTSTGNAAQLARMALGAGERSLKSAEKMEAKLAELEGEKAAKQEGKIAKAYENAATSFLEAIQWDQEMMDAYVGLEAAYRRSGKYAEALQVASRGLEIEPGNAELFSRWTEAVLKLDRLGDATRAYTEYAATDAARAGVVMEALKSWLAEHKVDPGEVPPEAVAQLEGWIAAQESGG